MCMYLLCPNGDHRRSRSFPPSYKSNNTKNYVHRAKGEPYFGKKKRARTPNSNPSSSTQAAAAILSAQVNHNGYDQNYQNDFDIGRPVFAI